MGVKEHRKMAQRKVRAGVLSMSSTRTTAEDESGRWITRALAGEGHEVVCHRLLPDDREAIRKAVLEVIESDRPDALVLTGGTGIAPRDVTIEAVRPLFMKELTAFAVLFAQLSFEEIDSAALLSRAAAGTVGRALVFAIPGSLKACKLAMKALILPELAHLVHHLREPQERNLTTESIERSSSTG